MALAGAIKEIQDQIKAKKAAIKLAQAELYELETELASAWALLKNSAPRGRRPLRKPRAGSVGVSYKIDSSVGHAVEVLREVKHPLHIDALVQSIRERGHEAQKTTLVGNLSRYVRESKIFSKPERSHYGLLEWEEEGREAPMGSS